MQILDINGRTDSKGVRKVVLRSHSPKRCCVCNRQMHFDVLSIRTGIRYCREQCMVNNERKGE